MRSIWRKAMAVWLAVVLVPSLLGGGACLSHVLGGAAENSLHASHGADVPAAHAAHAAHASHATTATAPDAVDAVAEAPPHDCCPQQGAPEHCSGASGCIAAVSGASQRAPQAMLVVAELNRARNPVAPPGPANAPDVPPPRA